jgi:hypothetical protein
MSVYYLRIPWQFASAVNLGKKTTHFVPSVWSSMTPGAMAFLYARKKNEDSTDLGTAKVTGITKYHVYINDIDSGFPLALCRRVKEGAFPCEYSERVTYAEREKIIKDDGFRTQEEFSDYYYRKHRKEMLEMFQVRWEPVTQEEFLTYCHAKYGESCGYKDQWKQLLTNN